MLRYTLSLYETLRLNMGLDDGLVGISSPLSFLYTLTIILFALYESWYSAFFLP